MRVNLVRNLKDSKSTDLELPTVKTAAALLDINHTSIYYKGRQVSDTELKIMNPIDQMHTDHPTWRKRQLTSNCRTWAGYPYLLRNRTMTAPNQVWSINITYIVNFLDN